MEKQYKKVGTHSGRFHADEVMSTAILKELFEIEVVRSRDPDVLQNLDIVYDVGEGEFDHHQAEKKFRENGTPYAACGLIWSRFGRDMVRMIEPSLAEEDVEDVYHYLEDRLIEGIDAVDNGVKTSVTFISTLNISSIISEFNPPWDSGISEDTAFHEAVRYTSSVLQNMLKQRFSEIRARKDVTEALHNRTRPEVLVLNRPYPWTKLLYQINTEKDVLFVVYPRDQEYLIQTVRKNDGTFGDRKRLPAAWGGKRDEELCSITGIHDATFCHKARFIAGAKSLESILKMADLAVAEPLPPVEARGFLHSLRTFLLRRRIVIRT